jgi:uncharacterized membrane protein
MIESLLSSLFGVNMLAYAMVVLRPKIFKTTVYKPMLLNIKLSIMPLLVLMVTGTVFVILQAMNTYNGESPVLWWIALVVAAIGLLLWLLLLPNAGYLITELNFNHREQDKVEVPLWYDIVGVLALALSGVMNMCFNVFIIQFMVAVFMLDLASSVSYLFDWISWIMMAMLMVFSSFGIYLGRNLRLNSWDVKHPVQFIRKLREHYKNKNTVKNCVLYMLFHALFFVVFYYATVGVVLKELITTIAL